MTRDETSVQTDGLNGKEVLQSIDVLGVSRRDRMAELARARALVREATRDVQQGRKRKREDKHAPMETSATKPVTRRRIVAATQSLERRDPRVNAALSDKTAAPVIAKIDDSRYGFLKDYRNDELQLLQAQAGKTENTAEKAELERTIRSLASRDAARKDRDHQADVLQRYKAKERSAHVALNKRPYHLKESAKREALLRDKFERLGSEHKVEQYMQARRKKRSQKEKRTLPEHMR
ncbi:rRNA bioproteinsis protein rrp36 [Savitreella phatthalungensis]